MAGSPLSLVVALLAYAGAFCLPTWTWCHVLPLRLGEVLRVSSVVRRTDVALQPTAASTVALWLTDLLTVALAVAPTVLAGVVGTAWALALTALLVGGGAGALAWRRRLAATGMELRPPGPAVVTAATVAWLLEAAVVLTVAAAAGCR